MQILNRDLYLNWFIIKLDELCKEIGIDYPIGDFVKKEDVKIINEKYGTKFENLLQCESLGWCASCITFIADIPNEFQNFIKATTIAPFQKLNGETLPTPFNKTFSTSDNQRLVREQIPQYLPNHSEVLIDNQQSKCLNLAFGKEAFATSIDFVVALVEFIDFAEKVCLFDTVRIPIRGGTFISGGGFEGGLVSEGVIKYDWSFEDVKNKHIDIPVYFTSIIEKHKIDFSPNDYSELLNLPTFDNIRERMVSDYMLAKPHELVSSLIGHFWNELIENLVIDYFGGVPYIPSIKITSDYLHLINVNKSEYYFNALWQVYQNAVLYERKPFDAKISLSGLRFLYIPPIASIIFEKASKPCDILSVLLEIRQLLKPLRDIYTEYKQIAANFDISHKEWAKNLVRMENSAKAFLVKNGYDNHHARPQTVIDAVQVVEFDKLSDGFDITDLSGKGLLKFMTKWPLEKIITEIRARKFRPLSKILKNYREITKQSKQIERLFGVSLGDKEIRHAEKYISRQELNIEVEGKTKTFYGRSGL